MTTGATQKRFSRLRAFLRDDSGATAIEYGLMVTLIGIAILSTIFAIGTGIRATLYDRISEVLAQQ